MRFFFKPTDIADYAERVARQVPGLADLHRMAGLLLAERVPDAGRVLVLGAGGGLELKALARMQPGWRFTGVDPSAEMLKAARTVLGDLAPRTDFVEGYIDDAPDGPFDAATCLLTLHFLEAEERRRTLAALHRRLRPGAPFVAMHHSFSASGAAKDVWLKRYAAFVAASGMPRGKVDGNIEAMRDKLPVLAPEADEALLRDAGFRHVELFYAAFTFKGWVCRA